MRQSHLKILFYLNSCGLIQSFSSNHLDTVLTRPSKSLSTRLNYAASPASLPDSSDPYVILNVQPGADSKEIKRAYRKLVLIHHPDTHAEESKARAGENFARLNAAYAYLTGKSDKLPKDSYQTSNTTRDQKVNRTYPSWNHPGTRKDYHTNVHMRNSSRSKYKGTPQYSTRTTTSSSFSFNPERYISEGWFSYYNPEKPSQYSPPRPPWNESEKHIRDFSTWAQVRDFDLHGNPIEPENQPDDPFYTPSMRQYLYTSANRDFGAVYAQRQKFDSMSSYQNASGGSYHENDRKIRYNDLVKDFAAFAKVRDYDSDGNPIDDQEGSSNDQEILYEVINDRFMREFEEYNQQIRNNKTNEASAMHADFQSPDQRMNTNNYKSFQSQVSQEHNKHHGNRGSVDNLRSYGMNPEEIIETMVSQPKWNHDQVRSFDIDGNPIDLNPPFQSQNRHHPFHTIHPYQESYSGGRNNHQSNGKTRVKINIDQVQGYDINGNPIFRDMSLYNQPEYETGPSVYSNTMSSFQNQQHQADYIQHPSPTNVQAYDIHGNNIIRPGDNSSNSRKKDSVYHQPGRI